ncbi:hypothetical protein V3481_007004 [Fusarium oxysporum f. sp. vasinfectum]|uniref:Uncharacterized protein n=1 Tax=Fusarium oxysporum f. sp. vasinfectum 25433 TaxID=1089449 RepID=X0KY03_FUSOX|nr:hypothetical protein FOTG_17991 [Fusarium oxysporum f. sp. vasinfectum 25433]
MSVPKLQEIDPDGDTLLILHVLAATCQPGLQDFPTGCTSIWVKRSALQAASAGGHEHIVKLLLDNGADVNAQGGDLYGTELQTAALEGHEHIVKLLLDNGANVNAQVEEHGTALQGAFAGGHEHIVKLLLDNGAYVNG